jgi:hypothetical protein
MSYDITKCFGDTCPLKMQCFRFTSEALARQDFFGQLPFDDSSNTCSYFWENTSQIQVIAYQIWEKNEKPNGQEIVHWEQAKSKLSKDLLG